MPDEPTEERGTSHQALGLNIVLEAVDREISFYRKRAGQVFFIGLSLEVLIAAGRGTVELPKTRQWLAPTVVTLLFIAVAAIGTILGSEYRRRIRSLKEWRSKILGNAGLPDPFPSLEHEPVSEILVLYLVLWFTSSTGALTAWVNAYPGSQSWVRALLIVSASFVAYSLGKAARCLLAGASPSNKRWSRRRR